MKKIAKFVPIFIIFSILTGCVWFNKAVDKDMVEEKCVIGKTTPQEVKNLFGEPYSDEVTRKGNGCLTYASVGFLGFGTAQIKEFCFKNGRLANFGSESILQEGSSKR